MLTEPQKDNFNTESPVRAFTEWQVDGDYAIGKGFRPSVQHLPTYLNAMLNKEGWAVLQVLGYERDKPLTILFVNDGADELCLRGPDETFAIEFASREDNEIVRRPYEEWPQWVKDISLVQPITKAPDVRFNADELEAEVTSIPEGVLYSQHDGHFYTITVPMRRKGDPFDVLWFPRYMEFPQLCRHGKDGWHIDTPNGYPYTLDADVLRSITYAEAMIKGQRPVDDLGAPHDTLIAAKVTSNFGNDHEVSATYENGGWYIVTEMKGHKITRMESMRGTPKAWRKNDSEPWTFTYNSMAELVRNEPSMRTIAKSPFAGKTDDPINPKHYGGRECADIGERLSANGYQILKYCWRLGEKDEPCQELGKALWYLDSEMALLNRYEEGHMLYPTLFHGEHVNFIEDRIADRSQFTQNIARMLWTGYGKVRLQAIKEAISEEKFHRDCGRGLAV